MQRKDSDLFSDFYVLGTVLFHIALSYLGIQQL